MSNKTLLILYTHIFLLTSCTPQLYITKSNKAVITKEQKAWMLKQWKAWNSTALTRDFSAVGRSWSPYYASPVFKSYILTNNNDTLKGLVKFWPILKHKGNYYGYRDTVQYYILLLPDGKDNNTGLLGINIKQVNYFRVYDQDTIPNNDRFIDIANLTSIDLGSARRSVSGIPDYPSLWRIEGKQGSIGIYSNDQFFWVNTIYKGKMLLVKNNKATSMYSWWSYLWHSKTTLLLKYINKNYQQHFRKGYFKDEKEEINYILDKESEK